MVSGLATVSLPPFWLCLVASAVLLFVLGYLTWSAFLFIFLCAVAGCAATRARRRHRLRLALGSTRSLQRHSPGLVVAAIRHLWPRCPQPIDQPIDRDAHASCSDSPPFEAGEDGSAREPLLVLHWNILAEGLSTEASDWGGFSQSPRDALVWPTRRSCLLKVCVCAFCSFCDWDRK
jgi:hypothetical protein